MREESQFQMVSLINGDLPDYYEEIYTGLSQKNPYEYESNTSGIATSTTNIIYQHLWT